MGSCGERGGVGQGGGFGLRLSSVPSLNVLTSVGSLECTISLYNTVSVHKSGHLAGNATPYKTTPTKSAITQHSAVPPESRSERAISRHQRQACGGRDVGMSIRDKARKFKVPKPTI